MPTQTNRPGLGVPKRCIWDIPEPLEKNNNKKAAPGVWGRPLKKQQQQQNISWGWVVVTLSARGDVWLHSSKILAQHLPAP